MGVTTPNAVFFHIPRTGGTWVTHSCLNAFKKEPKAEEMNVDVGWPRDLNGIHISPRHVKYKKFAFTFVRHPLTWYQSYYNLYIRQLHKWPVFIREYKGHLTELVKKFEKVDYVGRMEDFPFSLYKALDKAGEKYNPNDILAQHINVSSLQKHKYTKEEEKIVLKHDAYVINKYY